MRTVTSRASGGPATLTVEDLIAPVPQPEQVLIDVRAVGINYPDALMIEDRYQLKPPRPFAPGGEIAGRVAGVGSDVTRFVVGDRVLAVPGWGGLAERVAVDQSRCLTLPDAMPFDEAAAFLVTYGTSHHALVERAAIKAGQTLLVLGAGGGIGIAAVELGKALGAKVIAAASSQEKVDFALASGADRGIVYPADLAEGPAQRVLLAELRAACGGGADVVLDPVGGAYAEPALRTLGWNGRYLVIGFTAGIPRLPLNLVLLKSAAILGVLWGEWVAREPAAYQEQLASLMELYQAGKIRPRISARFPLEQAAEAIRIVGERRALGKVVVMVGP